VGTNLYFRSNIRVIASAEISILPSPCVSFDDGRATMTVGRPWRDRDQFENTDKQRLSKVQFIAMTAADSVHLVTGMFMRFVVEMPLPGFKANVVLLKQNLNGIRRNFVRGEAAYQPWGGNFFLNEIGVCRRKMTYRAASGHQCEWDN